MKSTVIRSLAVIGLMLFACVAACWHIVADGVYVVARVCRTVKDIVSKTFLEGLSMVARQDGSRQPSVRLVQAKSFYARLVRRDRLVTTDGWRMIPSI